MSLASPIVHSPTLHISDYAGLQIRTHCGWLAYSTASSLTPRISDYAGLQGPRVGG
jgi:hypothetical protein